MSKEKELINLINGAHDGKRNSNEVYWFMANNDILFEEIETGYEIFDLGFVSWDYLNGDVDTWNEIKEW